MQQAAATGYKFLILTNTLTGTNVKTVINVKGGGSVSRNHAYTAFSIAHASHSPGHETSSNDYRSIPKKRQTAFTNSGNAPSFIYSRTHTHLRKTTRDTHNNTLTDRSLITG